MHLPCQRGFVGRLLQAQDAGDVDEFAESVQRFSEWLSPHFPDLDLAPVHRNRSDGPASSMDERLLMFREGLSSIA